MIEKLLQPPVRAAEAFGDDPCVALFPGERAVIARAPERRRKEFATARGCARSALARLGCPPVPVLTDRLGAPLWPGGVTGSITHCAGYRAAAVALTSDVVSLGLDAAPNAPLRNPDMLDVIARDAERARLAGLANPTITVPRGARVTVRFVNNDSDEAHGWLITDNRPPFGFGQPAVPAIAGASAGVIGNPVSAGDGANTIRFTATSAGDYQYICPMPGHAQMGMHGVFNVR